jgi:hypothetical protein
MYYSMVEKSKTQRCLYPQFGELLLFSQEQKSLWLYH